MTAPNAYRIDLSAVCARPQGIAADLTCAEAYDLFAAMPDTPALAVIDADDQPLGVIYREKFMLRLADIYGRPLFEKKPISCLMERNPPSVERLLELGGQFTQSLETLRDSDLSCLLVVENGRYLGLVTLVNLLRIVSDHLQNQTLEAEAAKRDAEALAKGKTRFLANMTHELRTPLNGVIGFGQLLASEAHGPLGAPEYSLYAKDIVSSGEHLISIISDILDLAKIEAGRIELHERFVDLRELTGRALRMVAPVAADKGIRLHSAPKQRPWTIRADERRLQQAIINLLSNAIKFTPRQGDVGVDYGASAGWAWIEVWDEGCGIAEDDLERLFKPFSQLENARKVEEGTGLGLTITKALIQAHGGEVEFTSQLNIGTRARLLLPRNRLLTDSFAWSAHSKVEFLDPPEAEAV